ncbi:MAG TPA: hypothetical protein VJP89_05495 [Pyrinomonadaceae bacterium]|nr:hypothetical protein [Pyrinomonadaceae bacterium]
MKTLCIEKFFPPSSELTQNVIQRMRRHSLSDLQNSIKAEERPNAESSDDDDIWSDLLKVCEEEHQTSAEIEDGRRWLSEILYGYLARLSHSQSSPEAELYHAVEAIPEGMSTRLGLDDSKDRDLLEQLATEFQQWLGNCTGKKFVAGWGTIWLDPDNPERFGLTKFPLPVEQADESNTDAPDKAFSAGAGSFARSLRALFDRN